MVVTRQTLMTNWHVMRIFRLVFGCVAGTMAFLESNPMLYLLSALLLFQAVTNMGCCSGSCALPETIANNQNQ
jgi:hypothetical protein